MVRWVKDNQAYIYAVAFSFIGALIVGMLLPDLSNGVLRFVRIGILAVSLLAATWWSMSHDRSPQSYYDSIDPQDYERNKD